MLSSLSRVPPVWPSPRPEIMGTRSPAAAARGARGREIRSPTPPVECLSTLARPTSGKDSTSPVSTITRVRVAVSRADIPRKKTAIRNALIWYGATSPERNPERKPVISRSELDPSRLTGSRRGGSRPRLRGLPSPIAGAPAAVSRSASSRASRTQSLTPIPR